MHSEIETVSINLLKQSCLLIKFVSSFAIPHKTVILSFLFSLMNGDINIAHFIFNAQFDGYFFIYLFRFTLNFSLFI